MYLKYDLYCMWLWIFQKLFFSLRSTSYEKSAFWRFLPCCSFGLLCFSLSSTQNPDPDNHQASCHSSSLWNVWNLSADFTRLKKIIKKWRRSEYVCVWGGCCHGILALTQMELRVMALIDWETMSYTLLCEIPLQKTQWETGRGLIALTLADSGQSSTMGLHTGLCRHTRFIYTFQAAAVTYNTSPEKIVCTHHKSMPDGKH